MDHDTPLGLDRALAHPFIAHLARALRARTPVVSAAEPPARRAAVVLILNVDANDLVYLLMIKRAAYEGDPWSGHIALPGGRQEPEDGRLQDTAIRETREETSIDLSLHGCLLGRLDDVEPQTTVLPRIIITPFVAVLDADNAPLSLSAEVADAFWVSVDALRDPQASHEVVLDLTGGPRRVMSFQHGDHTIWGLTERILRQFLALLPAPAGRSTHSANG